MALLGCLIKEIDCLRAVLMISLLEYFTVVYNIRRYRQIIEEENQ